MTRTGPAGNIWNTRLRLVSRLVGIILVLIAGSGPVRALDSADLQRRAEAASRHLIARQTQDGHFLYEFDFLAGRYLPDDNIVRQSAVGYALGMMNQIAPSQDLERTLQRALKFDNDHSVDFGDGKLVSGDGGQDDARAGATAFAIMTLLRLPATAAPADPPPPLVAWLKGLIALQSDQGGFKSHPAAKKRDPYADGEAWLALAQTADRYPGLQFVTPALSTTDSGLMQHYKAAPNLLFSHWGFMAAAQRLQTTGDEKFAEFLRNYGKVYLHDLAPKVRQGANSCATVEGLTAAASALTMHGDGSAIVGELADRAEAEMVNALRLQIEPGQQELTFSGDRFYRDPKIGNFAGGFLNSGFSLRLRVDATQHCLSALIGLSNLQSIGKR